MVSLEAAISSAENSNAFSTSVLSEFLQKYHTRPYESSETTEKIKKMITELEIKRNNKQ